jgi:hypothetical protein
MSKKKSTEQLIEELALSIGKGFAEAKEDSKAIAKEMREGFAAIDQRLERVEFNTSGLDRRVTVIEDRILQLAKKAGLQFN